MEELSKTRGRRARRRRPMAVALAGALWAGASGCAAALSDRAPSPYDAEAHGAPGCTATPGLIAADATFAATYVQLGAWWLVSWESELLPAPPLEVILPVFGLAGAHAASGLYGYNETLRCKDAQWRHRARRVEGEEARHRPPRGGEEPARIRPPRAPGGASALREPTRASRTPALPAAAGAGGASPARGGEK